MTTKNKQSGYLIAQNSTLSAFFTSSSAYDSPRFLPLKEATRYLTAELANNALTKLFKNGQYSSRLVEASSMEFEFPDDGPNKNLPPVTQTSGDEDMSAGQLSDDPEDELNMDDDNIEMDDSDEYQDEDSVDQDDNMDSEENEQSFMSPIETRMMQGRRANTPSGNGPVRESATMPNKPQLDATPSENKNTALDMKKIPTIAFMQDTRNEKDTNYSKDIEPLCAEFKTPKSVMRAIKASIETFQKAADFNNTRDDAAASFALTVAEALRMIKDCLDLNTEEGLKQAQIKITTLMSPILNNFPPVLTDFLYKKGRQPISLKNMFYDVWDNKKKD
ncbi:hypothetical protein M0R04_07600 [Candidatus Dojkabacteria bacterium]|jgi:hypothetical protein|nr:hypothetical protein [Candidatus Dojkabacteria bacterium]